MKRFRTPSPPTVIAVIALFVALGGTGYAASHLDGSAGGARRATTAAKKKKARRVTTGTVNKLIAKFFAAHRAELTGSAGAPGTPGAPGAPGSQGATGPTGPPARTPPASSPRSRPQTRPPLPARAA